MKKIGIILRKFQENNKDFIGTRLDLFSTFKNANCLIIGIPLTLKYPNLIKLVKECDGIILSGGDNLTKNDLKLVKYLYQKTFQL